jgi:hypothetical protein
LDEVRKLMEVLLFFSRLSSGSCRKNPEGPFSLFLPVVEGEGQEGMNFGSATRFERLEERKGQESIGHSAG